MIKYEYKNIRWIKSLAIVLVTFTILWIGMNLSVFLGLSVIKIENMANIMQRKYQNCIHMLGVIVPIIYSLAFYYIFMVDDAHIILRYGRNKFEKLESKKIVIFSVLFAIEYMGVDLIFMSIFADYVMLSTCSYYLFMFLKFIMLIFYFNLIGMTLFCLRNILNFSYIYAFLGCLIYIFLISLYFSLMKEVSPSFFMDFAGEWFENNTFNSLTYILNLAKLIAASLIFMYLGQIIFLKRDIMGNEED